MQRWLCTSNFVSNCLFFGESWMYTYVLMRDGSPKGRLPRCSVSAESEGYRSCISWTAALLLLSLSLLLMWLLLHTWHTCALSPARSLAPHAVTTDMTQTSRGKKYWGYQLTVHLYLYSWIWYDYLMGEKVGSRIGDFLISTPNCSIRIISTRYIKLLWDRVAVPPSSVLKPSLVLCLALTSSWFQTSEQKRLPISSC